MNNKTKKILSFGLDALLLVLIAAIMFVSINTILSHNKGYTSYFGNVVYVAISPSMDGDKPDSFPEGAVIFCKELKTDEEKQNLVVGDVITFWTTIKGEVALNTHRIVDIVLDKDGEVQAYYTKGDHPSAGRDTSPVHFKEVVAKYTGTKNTFIGKVVVFTKTSEGFFVIVMIPSLLILGYCAFLFYSSIKKIQEEKKKKVENENKEAEMEAVKEKLRKELLAEMEAKQKASQPESEGKD